MGFELQTLAFVAGIVKENITDADIEDQENKVIKFECGIINPECIPPFKKLMDKKTTCYQHKKIKYCR